MSPHISDELPRILTGEASREVVLSAAAHLRTCVDCQHELVSAVVAHSSLTSAHRFAPELVTGMPPSGNLTDAVSEDADSSHVGSPDVVPIRGHLGQHATPDLRTTRDEADPAALEPPDLSKVFAQVRQEAAAAKQAPARHPSRARYLIGAAAAAVVLAGGTAAFIATSGSESGSHSAASRTVQLAAYDTGHTNATAKVADNSISLDASSLPSLSNKRYEVWLTNDSRTRMQPIGWIGNNGKATFGVPADLMTQYKDLEVSVQNLNADDYAFSGTSVLRGSLA